MELSQCAACFAGVRDSGSRVSHCHVVSLTWHMLHCCQHVRNNHSIGC